MHHFVPALPRGLRASGLTLVELLVVIVIVGLLTAIVLPGYQQSLYKSRRSDAMAALTTMQQAQERYRGSCTSYFASVQSQCPNVDTTALQVSTSPSGYYNLSIVSNSVSASGYTLRATAASGGKQAGDIACQIFEVQLTGGSVAYTPDPCWVK